MMAALHVQLRERFLQRTLDRSDFFGGMIFFHRGLRAGDRFLGRLDVDLLRLQRHVGQY